MNKPADTMAPCPFCGGEAFHESQQVICKDCEASSAWLRSKKEAIAAWNRRASLKGEAEPVGYLFRGYADRRWQFEEGDIPQIVADSLDTMLVYTTPPAPQAAKLDRCPDCYRPKARNADDCAAGCCAKWYAVRDGEAAAECAKLAAFWPAPQGGGERFAMESLPVNAPMQHPERNAAEQAYTQTAFNYEANPIGCRDWTIYWRGWWHRAVINDLATPPAQQPGEVGEADYKEAYSRMVAGAEKALYEIEDAGPKALKYAAQEIRAALQSADAALAPKEKGNG